MLFDFPNQDTYANFKDGIFTLGSNIRYESSISIRYDIRIQRRKSQTIWINFSIFSLENSKRKSGFFDSPKNNKILPCQALLSCLQKKCTAYLFKKRLSAIVLKFYLYRSTSLITTLPKGKKGQSLDSFICPPPLMISFRHFQGLKNKTWHENIYCS